MKKRIGKKRLSLSRETIRHLVPNELQQVAGGYTQACEETCGMVTACDCTTGDTDPFLTDFCDTNVECIPTTSEWCTMVQP